jgi:hypothetical protein
VWENGAGWNKGGEDQWLTGVANREVEAAQEFCVGRKN